MRNLLILSLILNLFVGCEDKKNKSSVPQNVKEDISNENTTSNEMWASISYDFSVPDSDIIRKECLEIYNTRGLIQSMNNFLIDSSRHSNINLSLGEKCPKRTEGYFSYVYEVINLGILLDNLGQDRIFGELVDFNSVIPANLRTYYSDSGDPGWGDSNFFINANSQGRLTQFVFDLQMSLIVEVKDNDGSIVDLWCEDLSYNGKTLAEKKQFINERAINEQAEDGSPLEVRKTRLNKRCPRELVSEVQDDQGQRKVYKAYVTCERVNNGDKFEYTENDITKDEDGNPIDFLILAENRGCTPNNDLSNGAYQQFYILDHVFDSFYLQTITDANQ